MAAFSPSSGVIFSFDAKIGGMTERFPTTSVNGNSRLFVSLRGITTAVHRRKRVKRNLDMRRAFLRMVLVSGTGALTEVLVVEAEWMPEWCWRAVVSQATANMLSCMAEESRTRNVIEDDDKECVPSIFMKRNIPAR
jgi:hypothetical protein